MTIQPKSQSFGSVLAAVQSADEDFEWYPTTNEIIAKLISDMRHEANERYSSNHDGSMMDIGAGNGKVLNAVKDAKIGVVDFYAIEKSLVLLGQLDPEIMVIGTDFNEQSLIGKRSDVVFCNPPYRQYERWCEKIIRQSSSHYLYLVIPQRWAASVIIADALKFRDAKTSVIGTFDFEDAEDRKARAKVNLVKVTLDYDQYNREDDAFERFFKEEFADLINKFSGASSKDDNESAKQERKNERAFEQLVVGANYPEVMVGLYMTEMQKVNENYQLVSKLDADLLREFNINPISIMGCLKARLSELRNVYWHELFSHLSTITDKMSSKSRKSLLGTLHKHVQVDFTVSNIYAVVIWVIKNANRYLDTQLIDTYEQMVDKANVKMYKSNQKTFRDDNWRYNQDPENKSSHFALDYRIVSHRIGGISTSEYYYDKGLKEYACTFLGDLLTVARNLGFQCETVLHCLMGGRSDWSSGENKEFVFTKDGKEILLFDVKAFKNGNLHIRLNKDFILALNVEYGRLKGWLRSGTEAAEELGDPKAAKLFKTNMQIETTNAALLLK